MLEEMKSIIAEQLNCSEDQINESTSCLLYTSDAADEL